MAVLSQTRRRPLGSDARARSLSPNLLHLLQRTWCMGYGTIRGIHFRDGDPLLDPPFQVVRKARLSEAAWPFRESAPADFVLKHEHRRLVEELTLAGTGVIDIKVVKGLPVDLDIYDQP